MIKRLNSKASKSRLSFGEEKEKREFLEIVEEYAKRMEGLAACFRRTSPQPRANVAGDQKRAPRSRAKKMKTPEPVVIAKKPPINSRTVVKPENMNFELYAIYVRNCIYAKNNWDQLAPVEKSIHYSKLEACEAYEKKFFAENNDKPDEIAEKYHRLIEELREKCKTAETQKGGGGAAIKRRKVLRMHGLSVKDSKTLAVLPMEDLDVILKIPKQVVRKERTKLKMNHILKVKEIYEAEDRRNETIKAAYEKALEFLKKYENKTVEDLSDREKVFIRISLRKKLKYEKDKGIEGSPSKFMSLLGDDEEEPEEEEDEQNENNETKNQVEVVELDTDEDDDDDLMMIDANEQLHELGNAGTEGHCQMEVNEKELMDDDPK